MKRNISIVFQMAMVFIGTIVGAGLASGQEITQFFTNWGKVSYISILIPCIIYIIIGILVIRISINYNLNSYTDLCNTVSPGIFGKIFSIATTIYLLSSTSIILAGSGALINQFFGVSKWIGTTVLIIITIFTLLRNTKGLIEINTFIVPSLILVITTIFILYIAFSFNSNAILDTPCYYQYPKLWWISSLMYGGFNILGCSGVIVPISNETQKQKQLILGLILGSIILTLLSSMINIMLTLNIVYIHKFEIPLLYVAHRFGKLFQIMLLIIIFFEMFSTSVSDIYSMSKTLNSTFGIHYKNAIFIVLFTAIPISIIGFGQLISLAYPAFGALSLFFIFFLIKFYIKDKFN